MEIEKRAEQFRENFERIRSEIGKVIVGHEDVIEGVLTALLSGGHVLLEGVPGLGKTMLVRALSASLDLQFTRIQFTPDLMPADIIGTNLIEEDEGGHKAFKFQPGPLFTQILLADEINRATPKTQSALLEAMQERRVTVAGTTYPLREPYFVLATQNPIEMEGTYPLPEAQLDRFFFKLLTLYPSLSELEEIMERTTRGEEPEARPVAGAETLHEMRRLVREIVVAGHVQEYAMRLVLATHPGGAYASESTNKFVRYGSSPRGGQALLLAGKVRALLEGRFNVSFQDIQAAARPALRHRLILNFEGEAENISPDSIIDEMVCSMPLQAERRAAREKAG
ncbi:MAG TPA: MoxR family ATPase [Firmicutes bacterium]|nr:MoxR family ATPase [Bacillota bacterium]